jgi:hypothetical protein
MLRPSGIESVRLLEDCRVTVGGVDVAYHGVAG